jgi:glutathione S-transferase
MLALEIKNIDYVSHKLDAAVKEHKSPEFLQLNPRGQVPVLRVEDMIVRESLAILAYLDQLKPSPGLFGQDAESTAAIWQWIMDFENHLRPEMATLAQVVFRNQIQERTDEMLSAAEKILTEVQRLDRHLKQQDYLCGTSISAADITLYPSLQWLRRALDKNPIPALTDALASDSGLVHWEKQIEALPGYDRIYPPHWH